jgi:predicted KAP-like P-loop ATPase
MPFTERSHNDKPISEPSEDRFGVNPFAERLAEGIRKIDAPEGTVIALNGPWGSGKSSIVNLILHHLKDAVGENEIVVINFACWWFRGEEALALEFFRELYAGLGPSLGKRFKKILPKLAGRTLRAGSTIGAAIDLTGATVGVGTLAGRAMSWLSELFNSNDTVEKLHAELTAVLKGQEKRFLIVIDDIDRLSPDEALLIFRLVKSVGRLPNVIYLLVFDRELAEAILSARYPSEGPHYLEKIIQAGFDIPLPRPFDLNQELLRQIEILCGAPSEQELLRFMNVFYDVIAPEVTTPRDLVRLTNTLSVTWAAVGKSVDRADLIAVETLRLLRPSVYRILRNNKEHLCGTESALARSGTSHKKDELDALLLGTEEPRNHDRLRRALTRLFPKLGSVWNNVQFGSDSASKWSRDRLVCSREHFDSYFRLSIGDDVLPREELEELIHRAADSEFVKQRFREAIADTRKDGKTKAALLLEELNLHADEIPKDQVAMFLKSIFELGDELDVDADKAGAFGFGDNQLRIHWLLRRLTFDRFDLAARSQTLMLAAENAALSWLVDFAQSAHRDHHPRDGEKTESERQCLTTKVDAKALRARALSRIREASQSGELAISKRLPYLLFVWHEFAEDEGDEVKAWTAAQMDDDAMIAIFAKAFTSYSWSQSLGIGGMGDTVAQRRIRAQVDSLDKIFDVPTLRKRVEELAASDTAVNEFLTAWRQRDKGAEG